MAGSWDIMVDREQSEGAAIGEGEFNEEGRGGGRGVGEKRDNVEGVKKGGIDVDESLRGSRAGNGGGETNPVVIGHTTKDRGACRVSVGAGEGDVAKPGLLDGDNVGLGGM
jgi:hypothetical protein